MSLDELIRRDRQGGNRRGGRGGRPFGRGGRGAPQGGVARLRKGAGIFKRRDQPT